MALGNFFHGSEQTWHALSLPHTADHTSFSSSADILGFNGILGSCLHISNFLESLRKTVQKSKKKEGLKGASWAAVKGVSSSIASLSASSHMKKLEEIAYQASQSVIQSLQSYPQVEPNAIEHVHIQLIRKLESGAAPVSKEELGRATWTLLHTLAAQFPDKPTRQQQRDAKDLMAILSRIYPCKQCADHFKEVLKANPVQTYSGVELAQWMCRVHNIVNRSLGKPIFPCERVDARWGALDCDEGACDLQGRMKK